MAAEFPFFSPPGISRLNRIQTVLFDLDGTLADTGPDLAAALNRVLEEEGRPLVEYQYIRSYVSQGALAMVVQACGLSADDPLAEDLRRRMVTYYSQAIARHTRLFSGMDRLLDELEARDIKWGIVTNKPAWLTLPLSAELGLDTRGHCIVSGDSLAHKKPHPAPVLHACARTGCAPEHCLFVGDAEKDIEAGRRAGTLTAAALFGYIGPQDNPANWGADLLLNYPLDLLAWLSHPAFHSTSEVCP